MTVGEIYNIIDGFAPFNTQMGFDNAGLLVGSADSQVKKIGTVLDITPQAVEYAAKNSIDLIISHHPVIFHPLKNLGCENPVYLCAAKGISAICAHTNLDAADGGVNDCLCEALELKNICKLADPETPDLPPLARVGELNDEYEPRDFAKYVSSRLHNGVRCVAGSGRIKRVAVCGGAGEDFILPALESGADALVTGDVRHHNLLLAKNLGLTLIDAGHFETENIVVGKLCAKIHELSGEKVVIIPQKSPYNVISD